MARLEDRCTRNRQAEASPPLPPIGREMASHRAIDYDSYVLHRSGSCLSGCRGMYIVRLIAVQVTTSTCYVMSPAKRVQQRSTPSCRPAGLETDP